jgi:hypothetical protein
MNVLLTLALVSESGADGAVVSVDARLLYDMGGKVMPDNGSFSWGTDTCPRPGSPSGTFMIGAPHAGLLRFLFLMNLFRVKKRPRPRTTMIMMMTMPTIAPEGTFFFARLEEMGEFSTAVAAGEGEIVVLLPVVVVGSEVESGMDEVDDVDDSEGDGDWEEGV